LCGLARLEPFSEETLGATFDLDYPDYEIIFCVHRRAIPSFRWSSG
jgi:ceramide glucosyltransferase